jgi:hypothetical protein
MILITLYEVPGENILSAGPGSTIPYIEHRSNGRGLGQHKENLR